MKNLSRFTYNFVLMINAFVALALLLIGTVVLPPARAETIQCGGAADMLALLDSRYPERPLFVGQMGRDASLIVTASPSQTSWTALVVGSDGRACIAALGTEWRAGDTPGPPVLGTEG